MVHVYIDPANRELRQQFVTHLPSLILADEPMLDEAQVFVISARSWPTHKETILKYRQRHFPGLIPVIMLTEAETRADAQELTRIGAVDELLPLEVEWEVLASRVYFWILERHSATKLNTMFSVLNALPAGVCIVVDEKIVYANQPASTAIHQPLSQIEGRVIQEFIDPRFHELLAEAFREAGDPDRFPEDENTEVEVLHSGQEERWLSLRIRPTYFLDNAGFFINLNDVTSRKKSEVKRAYQAHLLDLVQDSIIATDRDQRITYWNKASEEMLEIQAENALGLPFKEVFSEPTEHDLIDLVTRHLAENNLWKGVIPLINRSGEIIFSEAQVTRVPEENGANTGFIVAQREVTRQVAMQRQLEDRLRDFGAIHRISQHFLQGTDVQSTMQEACDLLQDHFEAASTWISYSPDALESAWVAFSGEMTADFLANYKEEFARNIRNHLFNRIMDLGEMVLLEDMAAHSIFDTFSSRYANGDRCSLISVPLFWQGERVGMFGMIIKNSILPLTEKAEVVKLLSNLITIGLHNTKLYQSLERNLREVKILYDIGSRLQQMRSPSELGEEMITIAEELMGYEYTALLVIDNETNSLVPLAISGLKFGEAFIEKDLAYIKSQNLQIGQGITGWVAAHGESIRTGDVRQEPRYLGLRDDIRSELCVPLIIGGQTIGVLNVETVREDAYSAADQRFLETIAAQFAIAVTNAHLLEKLQDSAAQLRRLARRVSEAHEKERKHISQELHDEIGQLVTAMRMSLRLVDKSLPVEAVDARERLTAAQKISDHLIKEVREIAARLRPPVIQEMGLLGALQEMAGRLSVQTGLKIGFEHCALPSLPDLVDITIYRVIQEGLTNAIRHAEATKITVTLKVVHDQVMITIEDDGRGIHASAPSGSAIDLRSIRDRIEPIMGNLRIESGRPVGTRLIINLPI